MKRLGAIVCALVMVLTVMAPAAFADSKDANSSNDKKLEIVKSSPEAGAEGVPVDNFSIKLYFSESATPSSDAIKSANAKQYKLEAEDGTDIPVKVYYSKDDPTLVMVAADMSNNNSKDVTIEGDTEYTLTIGKSILATDGSSMDEDAVIKVKTLNQRRSTIVYMILMVAMMVGMVFFTVRGQRKQAEKEEEEKKAQKKESVNPYKEAKKSGKSVQEVIEKDSKKKAKQAAKEAERKAELEALEAKILAEIKKERNKRVSGPRPISAAGSEYKVKVKTKNKPAKNSNKGSEHKKKGSKQQQKKKKK